jgi:hypothetical protein
MAARSLRIYPSETTSNPSIMKHLNKLTNVIEPLIARLALAATLVKRENLRLRKGPKLPSRKR